MRISDYRDKLTDLEQKLKDCQTVHDQFAYGYAKVILDGAITDLTAQVSYLNNLAVIPAPTLVTMDVTPNPIAIAINANQQLAVSGYMSDGTTRDVTALQTSFASFVDHDYLANKGRIMGVDVSAYTGAEITFYVRRTASGWDGADSTGAILAFTDLGSNKVGITDIIGQSVGVTFTTDGNTAAGDNFDIKVRIEENGTIYSSSNSAVATVDTAGKITGVAAGTATVYVTNNGVQVAVPVTVS
jgi:hypothetical protein